MENSISDTCIQAPPKTTWKDRLRWKLFPSQLPNYPLSEKYEDMLVINTEVQLSFVDRIRVLISGRLHVGTRTITENIIGRHETASTAYPLPVKSLERV